MSLLTLAQARSLGNIAASTLGDDDLQLLLDAAEGEIIERIGPVGNVTEYVRASGPLIMLTTRARSIVSVDESDTALDPTDYELRAGSRIIQRLDTGPRPESTWRGQIKITYTPADDLDRRRVAQLSLVKLGLDVWESGTTQSERIGDWSETFTSTPEARERYADVFLRLGGPLVIL